MKAKSLAKITKTSKREELNDSLKRLAKSHILVGIATGSKGDVREDGGPDNHLLGFVHEFGSPASNIPARPFLVPGIKEGKKEITSKLKEAMRAALRDDDSAVDDLMNQAGFIAVSSVKKKMQTGPFEPLKPNTIKHRHRSRQTLGLRSDEVNKPENVHPLVNTGALRDALDFYVRGRNGNA